MTFTLHPYPAHKPSGVPWLGDVPAHWGARRLKAHLLLNDSGVWGDNFDEQGVIVLRSTEQTIDGNWRISNPAKIRLSEAERDSTLLEANDLLVTKSSGSSAHIGKTTIVTSSIAAMNCCFSNFMQRIRLDAQVNPLLIWYVLNSSVGREQLTLESTTTTGLGNLNGKIIGDCYLPLPPLPEQAAIVRYLDHADRRIRRYVDAKRKLIALLEEEKQAILNQAVTRGMDPNVPLKPSGVEWLGDVPEHWDILQLGRVIDLATGFPFKSEGFSLAADDIRLLRGINVSLGRLRWEDVVRWPKGECSAFDDYRMEIGDIVLGMDRPFIEGGVRVALVSENDVPALLLQRVARIRPRQGFSSAFTLLLLTGKSFADYLKPIFTGISVPHVSPEQIKSYRIALPNMREQNEIVDNAMSASRSIQLKIARARRQVELLHEYRTRLIADVVTGKLDVREAAAQLPDEPDDQGQLQEGGPLPDGMYEDLHAPGEFAEELAMPSNMP